MAEAAAIISEAVANGRSSATPESREAVVEGAAVEAMVNDHKLRKSLVVARSEEAASAFFQMCRRRRTQASKTAFFASTQFTTLEWAHATTKMCVISAC